MLDQRHRLGFLLIIGVTHHKIGGGGKHLGDGEGGVGGNGFQAAHTLALKAGLNGSVNHNGLTEGGEGGIDGNVVTFGYGNHFGPDAGRARAGLDAMLHHAAAHGVRDIKNKRGV